MLLIANNNGHDEDKYNLSKRPQDRRQHAREKLRTLDGLEEYFWLCENTFPHTTVTLAEVEGATTVDAWRNALIRVQQRYPLLSARIRKLPGERPYFETVPGKPLPLRVLTLKGAHLDSMIANELVNSFGYADDLLARFTICHSPAHCEVLLSAHYAATDGRTNLQIIQDLIAAVSGEELGTSLPLFPTIGKFLGLGEPAPYTELSSAKAPSANFRFDLPTPNVRRHLLPANAVDALRATARAQSATVHGALVAAFFLAGKRTWRRWRTAPVMCFSPVDLRPMLNLSEALGAIISVQRSVMQPSDNLPFWEFARKLKQSVREAETKECVALGLNTMRGVVQAEGDPNDLRTIDAKGFYSHDLMISNYGDPAVRTKFRHLTLTALYPSVITRGIDTQSISAVTVDGALYMTQISRQPMPTLVEDACAILLDACHMLPELRALA